MQHGTIINLKNNWYNYHYTYVKGSAFSNGQLLKGLELARYISNSTEVDKRIVIERLNGFFAVVQETDQHIFVAADKIRSIPLFYSRYREGFLISDDPYWIKEQIGDNEFDELSQREFLLTGYVTGPHTLYKNIKQLQASEILYIGSNITSNRYYSFIHKDGFQDSKKSLLKKHDEILLESFKRLIIYANGRTIVVPLSGGYDSRLIVTMLRRLNYKNIVTFTYGKIDNSEYKVSKQVAERLSLKWLFIPYTNRSAFRWYNSSERKAYGKMADNLCSILLDREFPAVWELRKNRMIPEDSVFVPGHTGDFVSGGHIPFNLHDRVGKPEFVEQIVRKHYVMWDWQHGDTDLRKQVHNKIMTCAEVNKFDSHLDAASIYERWDWQERQVKYIVNSVRLYEFWNYDWWLPFWDTEYIQYWNNVPLRWRINKNLYDEYVVYLYSRIAGVTAEEAKVSKTDLRKGKILRSVFKKVTRRLPNGSAVDTLCRKLKTNVKKIWPDKEELYDTDWEQSYGRMNRELYERLAPYIVGRSSCATLERLGYISYTDSDVSEKVIHMLERMRNKP